jgi:hypothetical protein
VGAITFSANTCLPAAATAGITSRWATVGVVNHHTVHIFTRQKLVEVLVERDAASLGL